MFRKIDTPLVQLMSGLAIIFALSWLGSLISRHTGNLLPGSIIGMLLLAMALQFGAIKLHWVERTANQFVRWMSLLFVPIGVGLVEQLPLLQGALAALIATCVVATLVLLASVGWGVQCYQRRHQPVDEAGH